MAVINAKKYSLEGLLLTLFFALLVILSGCDATSDPKQFYQATGSWEGTIGADQVRGIIAPDNSYHLAIVVEGNSVGDYTGTIGSVDTENIGSMSLKRLQGNESSGNSQSVTFKVSANRLYSKSPVMELTRTPEANGPAVPDDVAGHWSLSAADNLTDVVVAANGTLSGGDDNYRYSGTMQLQNLDWNIFSFTLTTKDITTQSSVSYTGLAMKLSKEETRPRLWFAANSLEKTFLGEWSETDNVPPVAQMTILGERAGESVLVQKISPVVELDAQGSTDANNDALTSYAWRVIYPGGNSLDLTGSAVEFVPDTSVDNVGDGGFYTIELTVKDGLLDSDPIERQIRVEWTPDRFIGCNNGTVLDTRTNLLWLKDAGCVYLNYELLPGGREEWGVSAPTALDRVATLYDDGLGSFCGLSDGSALNDWRLPVVSEFEEIIYPGQFPTPPQLLNSTGGEQWSEDNAFIHVGTSPINLGTIAAPIYKRYLYWTADQVSDMTWSLADFNYAKPEDRIFSYFLNNPTAVWPVRALRSGEECISIP